MNNQAVEDAYILKSAPMKSRIPYRVSRLHNKFQAYVLRYLKKEAGLGIAEWRLIAVLNVEVSCIATDLVELTLLDKAQISKTVKNLTNKGLLEQSPGADGRQRILRLSEEGQKLHDRMAPSMNARRLKFVEHVTPDDLEIFFKVMSQLEDAVN